MNYGPSTTEILERWGTTIVRKHFAHDDGDRMAKEMIKLRTLASIGKQSEVFAVPMIINADNNFYDLEYIPNAHQLGECGLMFSTGELQKKLLCIVNIIAKYKKSGGNVWNSMLAKFHQLKTDNEEYNQLVSTLPGFLTFPNQDGYSHGDLSFDNIIVADEVFYLIDPSWSSIESPLWDVGKILQSVLINWGGIKKFGRALGQEREGWMNPLLYNVKGGGTLLDVFIATYSLDGVILSTACQLARVSRWCFADVLIPVINKLLHLYYGNGVGQDGRIDALCRII